MELSVQCSGTSHELPTPTLTTYSTGRTEWLECMRSLGLSTPFSSSRPAGCHDLAWSSPTLHATFLQLMTLQDEAIQNGTTPTAGGLPSLLPLISHQQIRQVADTLLMGLQ